MFGMNDVREEKIKEIKELVPTCRFCGKERIKVLPICGTPMSALNEVIGSNNYSYTPRYGAMCMNCGHIEYFVDFEHP